MDKITLMQKISNKLKFSTITYLVDAVITWTINTIHVTIDIKAKHSGHNLVPVKIISLNRYTREKILLKLSEEKKT